MLRQPVPPRASRLRLRRWRPSGNRAASKRLKLSAASLFASAWCSPSSVERDVPSRSVCGEPSFVEVPTPPEISWPRGAVYTTDFKPRGSDVEYVSQQSEKCLFGQS